MTLLIILATTISDIIEFVFGAATLVTILTPLLVLYMFDKIPIGKPDAYIATALILSAVFYGWLFVAGYFENIAFTVVPVAVSAILIGSSVFLSRLVSNSRQKSEKNKF